MAKQPKEAGEATNTNIAFDATKNATVAVVEQPVPTQPAEPKRDYSGIYQFSVSSYTELDGAKQERRHTPHIALPIIHKIESDGKVRKYPITIGQSQEVKPLKCPKCANIFEYEPLLRPGGLKNYPEEQRWFKRHRESFMCPQCKANGEFNKGVPVSADGMNVVGRKVRPTYYLNDEEYHRMRKYLTDGRPIEQVSNQRQADGKNMVVGTGNYRDIPFTRHANVNGMDSIIQIGPLVICNELPYPESWSPMGSGFDASAAAVTANQVRALQSQITTLDANIDAAMTKGKTQTEMQALFAKRRALVEQVNTLTQQNVVA